MDNPESVNFWTSELREKGGVGSSVVSNSYKAIMILLKYLKSYYKPSNRQEFREKCTHLCDVIEVPKTGAYKHYNEELRRLKYQKALFEQDADMEFVKIFKGNVVETIKDSIIVKDAAGVKFSEDEMRFITRICITTISAKYSQRPGVAKGLKVEEYNAQMGNDYILVYEHKTGHLRTAYFPFTDADRFWFNLYYTKVRPVR